jgi:hypothetical protein
MKTIAGTINGYNNLQTGEMKDVCILLESEINKNLKNAESKIWHGTPVWFLEGNPVISYYVRKSKKDGERLSLMFFSGQSFEEKDLKAEGKFKAAEIFYTSKKEIVLKDLKRWLIKSVDIQWDYKNLVKRKGVLLRLK